VAGVPASTADRMGFQNAVRGESLTLLFGRRAKSIFERERIDSVTRNHSYCWPQLKNRPTHRIER
jgi:hypothetical protein